MRIHLRVDAEVTGVVEVHSSIVTSAIKMWKNERLNRNWNNFYVLEVKGFSTRFMMKKEEEEEEKKKKKDYLNITHRDMISTFNNFNFFLLFC